MDETLAVRRQPQADHERPLLVLPMIQNTGVRKWHQPLEQTLLHPGFEARNRVYTNEARAHVPSVVLKARASVEVPTEDIDAIVLVLCTGFSRPPDRIDDQWHGISHEIGRFSSPGSAAPRPWTDSTASRISRPRSARRLPGRPRRDIDVGSLRSTGLFGDTIATAITPGIDGTADAAGEQCFHFQLGWGVPETMSMLAPPCAHWLMPGWDASQLDRSSKAGQPAAPEHSKTENGVIT
jgi:1,3,6,8-tetrahydroxynaphthalene synthase